MKKNIKICDRDTSSIISTGSLEIKGYLTRVTDEVIIEAKRHGIEFQTGTYIRDQKIPGWKDFTSLSKDSNSSIYKYNNNLGTFTIWKFNNPDKSDFFCLCGEINHKAGAVIFSPECGQFNICRRVVQHGGDFSLVRSYIFDPRNHKIFDTYDRCLGKTLENIIKRQKHE